MLEIVHWFDPSTFWPEDFHRIESLDSVHYDHLVNVLILNPKRRARV